MNLSIIQVRAGGWMDQGVKKQAKRLLNRGLQEKSQGQRLSHIIKIYVPEIYP